MNTFIDDEVYNTPKTLSFEVITNLEEEETLTSSSSSSFKTVKRSKRVYDLVNLEEPKERRRNTVLETNDESRSFERVKSQVKRTKYSVEDPFTALLELSHLLEKDMKASR